MECNEKFLRQMFESPYGDTVGRAILERLEHGMTVTVVAMDGSRIQLNNHDNAVQLLVDKFGWRAGQLPPSETPAASPPPPA